LWGDEKPISLDELTLNICPDDDMVNPEHKKKMVWDNKKKNFVRGNVDRAGQLIKTNESGVRVKKNDKAPNSFKRWKSKNHLKIQRVGEFENDKVVTNAQSAFRERKVLKEQRAQEKNMKINGGKMQRKVQNEVKTFDQIVKSKKEDFKKKKKKEKISKEKMQKQKK